MDFQFSYDNGSHLSALSLKGHVVTYSQRYVKWLIQPASYLHIDHLVASVVASDPFSDTLCPIHQLQPKHHFSQNMCVATTQLHVFVLFYLIVAKLNR